MASDVKQYYRNITDSSGLYLTDAVVVAYSSPELVLKSNSSPVFTDSDLESEDLDLNFEDLILTCVTYFGGTSSL